MTYLDAKQNARFLGSGQKNSLGQSLQEFLEEYDPRKYDSPCNTVDTLIFRSRGPFRDPSQPLKLLMIRRSNHPSIGMWALPGGFVEIRENLETAAARELEEETGVSGLPLVQLGSYGDYDRDPRWRVITTAYIAVLEQDIPVQAGDDAADALWMDVCLNKEKAAPDRTLYTLTLSHPERDIRLSASAENAAVPGSIWQEDRCRLLSSDGIASDHGQIIIDALLHLYGRLSNH